MKVKAQYVSLVKSITNTNEEEFNLKDGTLLSDLLNKVASKYGRPFINEVYEPGQRELKTNFVVMINGVLMGQLQGVDTPLKDGDKVTFMSLMTGG